MIKEWGAGFEVGSYMTDTAGRSRDTHVGGGDGGCAVSCNPLRGTLVSVAWEVVSRLSRQFCFDEVGLHLLSVSIPGALPLGPK